MSQEPQTMPKDKTASAGATPPAPPTDGKVVPIKKGKRILEPDFMLNVAGQAYQTYLANVAVGVTDQDCLEPLFWANVARKVKPMDRIEVWAKDGVWFGEFRVVFADNTAVRLQKVQRADIDASLTTDLSDDSDYTAGWIAPPLKYGVRRKSDKEVVASNFETLFDAHQWISRRTHSARA